VEGAGVGAEVGAVVGLVVGAAVGLAGAVVGLVVGAAVGAVVGAAVGVIVDDAYVIPVLIKDEAMEVNTLVSVTCLPVEEVKRMEIGNVN
jgi:uncharacterized membrane protein